MNGVVGRIKVAQPQTHLTSTFIGCLMSMTDGDLSSITGEHWGNAIKNGGITAGAATVLALIGLKINDWTRALLCGITTFGVEALFKSPTYGTTMSDIYKTALVAGVIAAVLALVAGKVLNKYLSKVSQEA